MQNTKLIYSNAISILNSTPNKIAAVDSTTSLTYEKLFSNAQLIAEQICEKNVEKEVIAVLLDKGCDQVVANLGVTLAGSAYFPIDPTWPEQRIKQIIHASATNIIITNDEIASQFNWLKDYELIDIDQVQDIQHQPVHLKDIAKSSDLAYVIFTSGSTGTPKGVAIEHHSVHNTIQVFNETFSINNSDCVLSLSPVSFDLSVYDIFGLLSAGGTIVIPDPKQRNDPKCWIEYLDRFDITIWNTAPALGQMLADYVELAYVDKKLVFPKVKLVALGGDWIPLNLPDRLRKIFPNATLMSGGGSTETSIWGCWYIINDVLPNWKSIPYGKAIKGQQMQVLKENLTPCEVGEIGEIYFSGIGLAREYWRAPDLTASKFVFCKETQNRYYKSGDLGRLLQDGNIEFISRIDQQVQINGYRVELSEVEKHLSTHPDVERAIVIGLDTSNRSTKLAAVVMLRNKLAHVDEVKQSIRDFLTNLLPSFMVPNLIMVVDEFPLSKHGKVDKLQLKSLFDLDLHNTNKAIVYPENQMEEEILNIWQEVLKVSNISTDASFLSLGGTSVLAVAIIARIENIFSVYLPVSLLLNNATVKTIAAEVLLSQSKPSMLLPQLLNKSTFRGKHNHLPMFLIHPGGGTTLCYENFASIIEDRRIYGIEFPYGEVKTTFATPEFTSEWLADLYVQKILSLVQPPCIIGGWSAGGALAYAVAKRLEQLGHTVPLVLLIDSACPNVYREQKDKITKVNSQALTFYLSELNKHFTRSVSLEDFEKNSAFELSMFLPDLIRFIFNQLDMNTMLKKEISPAVLNRFVYIIEGTIRANLNTYVTGNVERILFIKAEKSDISTAKGWEGFGRQPMFLSEIPNTSHLSIIEKEHVMQLKEIFLHYTDKLNI